MKTDQTTVGGKVVTVSVPDQSTYSLFIKNIASVSGLKPVMNVINAPVGATPAAQMFGLNTFRLRGSADGRFFAMMYPDDDPNPEHAPVVSYFNSNGYVDLQTGALFDETGMPVGYSLSLNDWLAVLDKTQVTVAANAQGVDQLVYRNSAAVKAQTANLVADAQAAVAGKSNIA